MSCSNAHDNNSINIFKINHKHHKMDRNEWLTKCTILQNPANRAQTLAFRFIRWKNNKQVTKIFFYRDARPICWNKLWAQHSTAQNAPTKLLMKMSHNSSYSCWVCLSSRIEIFKELNKIQHNEYVRGQMST